MSRAAILTGTAGGIIGTITAGIGIIWSLATIIVTSANGFLWYHLKLVENLAILSDEFWLYFSLYMFELYYFSMITGDEAFPLILLVVLGILLIVSCILTGVGFYGVYKAGGGAMGLVSFIFGIIGGALAGNFLFLEGIFGALTLPSPIGLYFPGWIGMVVLGVTFIIFGVSSIVVRETTTRPRASVAAGILSIVGACLFFPSLLGLYGLIMVMVGFALMFVAFLLWAIVFYSSRDIQLPNVNLT